MDQEEKVSKIHVIVLPFHMQGHMNPMLQFAKRLTWKGASISLATTLTNARKMEPKLAAFKSMITLHSIYDDSEATAQQLSFKDRMERFQAQATHNLATLITGLLNREGLNHRLALVFDAGLPWAVNLAKEHNIVAAVFCTQSCATMACLHTLYMEAIGKQDPLPLPEVVPPPRAVLQEFPNVSGADLKSKLHPIVWMVLQQCETLDQVDCVLFNCFDKLEPEFVKWMSNLWPVKTIGPTLPSFYLDKQIEDDVDYGFNLYKPKDEACMKWLSTKEVGSVVYASFGSAASLSVGQVAEIAEALKENSNNFLWVVRETELLKLPNNFISETSNKGLVVSWCLQLDVLAHEAIGCFVTHCGWNSTMEALSFGVPMVAMPQFLDQRMNAHFVDEVWGAGIQPKVDAKGLVTSEEIRHCIMEIMKGEREKKIKESVRMWKKFAKEATDEGGTSDKHIAEFIAELGPS